MDNSYGVGFCSRPFAAGYATLFFIFWDSIVISTRLFMRHPGIVAQAAPVILTIP